MNNQENTLITVVAPTVRDGGGWVTRRLLRLNCIDNYVARGTSYINKLTYAIFGLLALPFLHPIFTRYIPIKILLNRDKDIYLNFSQTFGGSCFKKNCTLICHDLQCHRPYLFIKWARWSERYLLNKADKVQVLSLRDAKIVHRYYGVPYSNIHNIWKDITFNLNQCQFNFDGPIECAVFLGSLDRFENHEGILWFVDKVLPFCPLLKVKIVGSVTSAAMIKHSQLEYLGFVEDINSVISESDLMIAPMFSSAGIKIKVIESIERKLPVLGTKQAYSGFFMRNSGFCSNEPRKWIDTINKGGLYIFNQD